MKNNEYVLCDNCGAKIYANNTVYKDGWYRGLYCSPECYCEACVDLVVITDELVEEWCCKVYEDE